MKPVKKTKAPVVGYRSTRIYCRPDCSAGKRMNPENRVHFDSRKEAVAKEFRACKICKPNGLHPEPETFYMRSYTSPLGAYVLVSSSRGLVGVKSDNRSSSLLARWEKNGIRIKTDRGQNDSIARELDDYFAEKRIRFTVPLDLRGTDFQLRVWQELQCIPYGETLSYGQIASAIGRPTASRAVGGANNRNPVAIVVPCHRVIGAGGSLVGYAGGVDRKQALLDLEARVRRRQP